MQNFNSWWAGIVLSGRLLIVISVGQYHDQEPFNARVVQLVERRAHNPEVGCANHPLRTISG